MWKLISHRVVTRMLPFALMSALLGAQLAPLPVSAQGMQLGHQILCVQAGAPTVPSPCTNSGGTAYATIQAAVNAANSTDEVRVASGTYTGAAGSVLTFPATVGTLSIHGGFDPSGTGGWTTASSTPTTIDGGNPGADVITVPSTLSSLDLANLAIQNGALDIQNAASTVSLTIGPLTLQTASKVVGAGTLQLNGGSLTANSDAGSSGTLAFNTLSVLAGTATFSNAQTTAATATLGNFGIITGPSTFTVTGPLTWDGGGVIRGPGQATIGPSGSLTFSGSSSAVLDNRTLTLNGTTTLPSASGCCDIQMINSSSIVNNGTFNNLGSLSFNGGDDTGSFTNSASGTLSNSGTWVDTNTFSTKKWLKSFTNNGAFTPSGLTTIGATFTNTSSTDIQGGILDLFGGGSSTGPITVESGAVLGLGGGTFSFTNAGGDSIAGPGTVDFTGGTTTIAGPYNLTGIISGLGGTESFTGSGTFDPNTLTIGAGSFTVGSGATIGVGALNVSGGTVELDGTSPAAIASATISAPGQLQGSAPLSFTGPFNWTGGTLVGPGSVTVQPGGMLNLSLSGNSPPVLDTHQLIIAGAANVLANKGGIPVGLTLQNGASIINSGTFTAQGSLTLKDTADAGTFQNLGALNVQAGTVSFPANYLANAGTVSLGSGATLTLPGNYTQTGGTTSLVATSTLAVTGNVAIQGGSLAGAGVIEGNVTNDGTLQPSLATGGLAIQGNYTQGSTGILDAQLGGETVDTGFSQVTVSNLATLGGTLDVSLANGFTPKNGDTFPILVATSATGTFGAVNGTTLGGGGFLTTTYPPTGVDLVATVPTPTPGPTMTPTPSSGMAPRLYLPLAPNGATLQTAGW